MLKLHKLPFFDTLRNLHLERYYKNFDPSPIEKLKDLHKDERCFMVGTGPSLTEEKLEMIRKEIVFGTNTSYKLFFKYAYYCISDKNVWKRHKFPILRENTTLLLSGHAGRDYLKNKEKYKNKIYGEPAVFKDLGDIKRNGWQDKNIKHGTYWGDTIMVDLCLQVAYWMGFKDVYLLGCDCDYSVKEHFDGEKYGFDKKTNRSPEYWEKVFAAYKEIKKVYDKEGRKIYNATPNGNLNLFERVNLEDIV